MVLIQALAGPSRQITRRSLRSIPTRRYQSTYPSSPSPKVLAAPFLLDPADAAHKLHMNALIASAKGSNLFLAGLLKLFGPSIGALAQQFGLGGDVVMRDMKAIYWPVWRIDAMLEGSVEGKDLDEKEGMAYFGVQEAYVPGESTDVHGTLTSRQFLRPVVVSLICSSPAAGRPTRLPARRAPATAGNRLRHRAGAVRRVAVRGDGEAETGGREEGQVRGVDDR
jgi:hypothetical protein